MTPPDISVYSFGERGKDQWYARKDGMHISCKEEDIEKLWKQWIMNHTAKRADNAQYNIFMVTEPPMIL